MTATAAHTWRKTWPSWASKQSDGPVLPVAKSPSRGDDPDHRVRAASSTRAAKGLGGDRAEAARLCRELIPEQTRVLGADHPLTLISRNGRAWAIGQTRDWAEAARLFRELIP